MKLTPSDITSISYFNDSIFFSSANERREGMLERKISETREALIKLMRELDGVKKQPAIEKLSETAVKDFFKAHPSMTISYEEGKFILASENQSVSFHTMRNRNAVGINDDIIYVSLPLYSFKLVFFPDGTVQGSAEKSLMLEEVWPDSTFTYGHPHTQLNSGSRYFSRMCNGNNKFIQNWSDMRNGGVMDGNTLMRILNQAAIWLEVVNISDMYGTELASGPYISDNIADDIDVDGLLHYRVPLAEGAPTLQFILDSYGAEVYRAALWPLWMCKHFDNLPSSLGRCHSMRQAALLDAWIILNAPETFGAIYSWNKEMTRVVPISIRCYRELGGYYLDSGDHNITFAQGSRSLFPENSNNSHTEENNVPGS